MLIQKSLFFIVTVCALTAAAGSVYAHGKNKHGVQETRADLKPVELYLPEMNAERGKKLFINKGCITCHSINGVGGEGLPLDTSAMKPRMNAFQFAARMFNHSVGMIATQEEVFGEQIKLTGQELADITAFTHDHKVQHTVTLKDIPHKIMMKMHH